MERTLAAPPAADADAKAGPQSRPAVAPSAARSQEEAEPLVEQELSSGPSAAAAAASSSAATTGGASAAMPGVRRPMSWRRGSLPTGASRADPRRRASSLAEEMEALRRKAAHGSPTGGARGTQQGDRIAEAEEEELTLLHFQDVREELELSGHNLTSVLNNPRETFMDSLYEAAFEAELPLPDLEVVRANVPHGLREITPQVKYAKYALALHCCCVHTLSTYVQQPVQGTVWIERHRNHVVPGAYLSNLGSQLISSVAEVYCWPPASISYCATFLSFPPVLLL